MNEKLVNMIEECGIEVEDIEHIINEAQGMAVMNFVNVQIGAFESGFIKESDSTLFDMYQYARIHVKDNYKFETPHFSIFWGTEMICHCSGGSMSD